MMNYKTKMTEQCLSDTTYTCLRTVCFTLQQMILSERSNYGLFTQDVTRSDDLHREMESNSEIVL
jgi:hypothetical protein